ncbi:MAG: bile acid:sodium symporter family protein [Verrucomicrobiales bacterium]|nr:bile acid:sodium symporter family protein [Verrucomicrobiales bacterium]
MLRLLTNLFPAWILITSILALFFPGAFTWFSGPWIVYGLGVIMLGMGMTLTFDDFKCVLTIPRAAVIGVICQFTIMPLCGFGIAHLLQLHAIDPHLALGLILVSCCPGGTASNVVAFLARANVALSVSMTVVSTFAAILLTPFMTKWLVGKTVEVDALALLLTTVKVVLVPVVIGVLLNRFSPKFTRSVRHVSPLVSVIAIVLIVASIIGKNNTVILEGNWRILAAPALLHLAAFSIGYVIARFVRLPEDACRTISIEVGMQNSGLGTVLATKHFPGTVAPVPCAISAAYHCIIGSILAGLWRLRPVDAPPADVATVDENP